MQHAVRKYALLGWPVGHSVSPPMQEAAFRAAGIPAAYTLRPVPPERLSAEIHSLCTQGFDGWNITVPHKQRIIPFLDEVDPEARAAGSVNTVVNRDGRLIGCSTDGCGMAAAVRESFGLNVKDSAVVFLGAGGAARAVSIYFARHGAKRIWIFNRTLERACALAEDIARCAPGVRAEGAALDARDRQKVALAEADLLIQATSLGLHDGDPAPMPPEFLRPGLAVVEMIYRPTQFLRDAARAGCRTADGRGMLLHQGAESFRIWTGRPAPIEAMRHALDQALTQ
ncbi:MAG: shikimate dehydrogenase [Kiritimatiellaeota bacterium]|nr:shikimate dehydrogenase [Kiritimatiellota bacterium]